MREMKRTMRAVMGSIADRGTQPRKLRVGQLVYSPQSGKSHLRSSRLAPCSFASRLPSLVEPSELRDVCSLSVVSAETTSKAVDCNQRRIERLEHNPRTSR